MHAIGTGRSRERRISCNECRDTGAADDFDERFGPGCLERLCVGGADEHRCGVGCAKCRGEAHSRALPALDHEVELTPWLAARHATFPNRQFWRQPIRRH
jgi:hypothetical protein